MRPSQIAAGSTLVELLVVIGVLGVIAGLLIPAVQRAREAASRLSCQDRIRQIALACHHYHAVRESLPLGAKGGSVPRDQLPYSSWLLHLTPYLELQPLWDQAVADYSNPNIRFFYDHKDPKTLVTIFQCPSDPRVQQLQKSLRSYSSYTEAAYTSFAGVSGTNHLTRDGVLFVESAIRLEQVTDGTSSTLLLGERPPTFTADHGVWYLGTDIAPDTFLGVTEIVTWQHGTSCVYGPYHYGPGLVTNPCDDYHFWSLHPGGANFAMCDGSVHFISYLARDLMPALATRSGGEVVALP